jgi:hypothetical protein
LYGKYAKDAKFLISYQAVLFLDIKNPNKSTVHERYGYGRGAERSGFSYDLAKFSSGKRRTFSFP